MKVLLSAYACEPGSGSEPEVGLRTMLAVAEEHDVWVLTRQNNTTALSAFLEGHPNRSSIRLIGFDLGNRTLRLKRIMRRFGTLWYYDRWQNAIGSVAESLDREQDFDVVHHVTLGAHWGRIGVARLDKPLVVGPVGGAATSPVSLLPILGLSGIPGELSRRIVRPLVAQATGALRVQRGAAIILAQNEAASRAMGIPQRTTILPHGLIGASPVPSSGQPTVRDERFVFAGRLVGWKGPLLAIRAMAEYPSDDAILEIYGRGIQRARLERETRTLGLGDRVLFRGSVPRDQLLERIATCSALLHPALHDDSPLIVAEALSVGTPVVCLDLAGPPVIAGYWPAGLSRAIPPSDPRTTAIALARGLAEVVGSAGAPDVTPGKSFRDQVLASYERAVGRR